MATGNPNAWRTRTTRSAISAVIVLAWFPLNGAANTWYYTRPKSFARYREVDLFASVDGASTGLANLQLRIQAGDGMTRLRHHAFFDIPASCTSENANPFSVASPTQSTTGQQQIITLSAPPTGGNFTVTFNGQTATIPATWVDTNSVTQLVTAAQVQSALQALSTIGTAFNNNARAQVTGPNGGPFNVQFFDSLIFADVPSLSVGNGTMTGATVSVASVPTGPIATNSFDRYVDSNRFGVKWGTASSVAGTNLILTARARG